MISVVEQGRQNSGGAALQHASSPCIMLLQIWPLIGEMPSQFPRVQPCCRDDPNSGEPCLKAPNMIQLKDKSPGSGTCSEVEEYGCAEKTKIQSENFKPNPEKHRFPTQALPGRKQARSNSEQK